ncbi:MAG: hypothetical protein K2Z81_09865 [Cyanobacteria bacterium]|nr:hypothetical protein [Cyanobacteriota bacterium]
MTKVRLGELLVEAKVVTSADLMEAIQVSKKLNVPIGRVLLTSGGVRQDILEAALEAQPLINEGTLSKDKVVQTLNKAHEEGFKLAGLVDFDRQFKRIQASARKLADLLIDSEIVSQEQIDSALNVSSESGMPLGTTLVLEGILSPSLYPSISHIQENIRLGVISREDGVQQIKSTFLHWLKTDEADARFVLMGQPEDEENEGSNELSKNRLMVTQPIQVKSKLSIVKDLTKKVTGADKKAKRQDPRQTHEGLETLKPPESPTSEAGTEEEVLHRDGEETVEQPVTGPPQTTYTLIQLLKRADCFTQKDIEHAYDDLLRERERSCRFVELLGLVDKSVLAAAVSVHELLSTNEISEDEAIKLIRDINRRDLANRLAASDAKLKNFIDKQHKRRAAFGTVLGGLAVGAAIAGFSIFNRSKD